MDIRKRLFDSAERRASALTIEEISNCLHLPIWLIRRDTMPSPDFWEDAFEMVDGEWTVVGEYTLTEEDESPVHACWFRSTVNKWAQSQGLLFGCELQAKAIIPEVRL